MLVEITYLFVASIWSRKNVMQLNQMKVINEDLKTTLRIPTAGGLLQPKM